MEYHLSPMILRSWFIFHNEGWRCRGFCYFYCSICRAEGFGLLL